ncbi:hypothetical protein J0624_05315 [Streptococcus suis]|uniref:hypothetical protein n=1 Tax=Streptococcus suis TaxID=1307 RepID=UPI001146DB33|nr:hypothetical protein [Streptococcus suis]MCB2922203.1 hypothetical protein [Streptococcus suis]MCB2932059.1 hypothetical protein [Streptococcus suis]MCB2941238.1 hypothetical protein [Streptococcus suis]MCB2941685.1 hypothetical protein [Streptococcus suis]MCB2945757.1 hypothetical protein [Streptococcus suis]
MDYKDENGVEYHNMRDMEQVREFQAFIEEQDAQENQPKLKKNRVYPWTGMDFWDFVLGTLKLIFLSPIFILLFCINLVRATVSLFITWIIGKLAILLIIGFGGGLLLFPFPQLDESLGRFFELCCQWFFNVGTGREMTLFPGGAIEIGIILFLSVLGAFGMTANFD